MSNTKPLLAARIEVYFTLKSRKSSFPVVLTAASALLPPVVWWGCEIVDLPPGAPEYQAIGLGEVGHTLSTLGAGLCVQVVPKRHALSVAQALWSSSPQVSLCYVIPGADFNWNLLLGASVADGRV